LLSRFATESERKTERILLLRKLNEVRDSFFL
jgi:hypothetical protein